ncbi:hypothetical protein ES708_23256 [subsurface metagenome]
MAIKSKRNFKVELGIEDLTLTANTGESILITDVKIYEPAAMYANFLIQRTAVGFYRVASLLGNHLHFHPGRAAHSHDWHHGAADAAIGTIGAQIQNAGDVDTIMSIVKATVDLDVTRVPQMTHTPSSFKDTLLAYLGRKGIFKGFPVAEGETFTIELITGATAVKMVEYDIYDAADITNVMENGSKADTYMYVNYGDTGADLQLVVETVLGESNNPTEYPDFPFGGIVPSGHKIELIGILASDVAPLGNAAGTYSYTEYLKLMKGREVLFDEDHNGLLYYAPTTVPPGDVNIIGEGYAVGGNYTQCDIKQPLMFDPPLVFNEGEELSVAWHIANEGVAGVAISQELQEVGMILRISPMV